MLGAHPIEVALGSTYDRKHYKTILAAMANAGLAVFPLAHNEKEPVPDQFIAPATLKKMRAADENTGAGLATNNRAMLHRWLKRWQDTHDEDTHFNLGLNPGPSRLLIVDVDTAAEKWAFLDYWSKAEGWADDPNVLWEDVAPTVMTPGDHDAAGNMIHSDGGHYYFTLPEGWNVPSTGPGVFKMPGGWAIYMRDCYVLCPPSARAEGPYLMAGRVREAPDWLLEAAGSKQRVDPATEAPTPGPDTDGDDTPSVADDTDDTPERPAVNDTVTIDDWAANQTWDDLLTNRDFVAYKPDKCGDQCTIYTDVSQPHASKKSATAHGPVCSQYDPTMGHGPLHFWTDNAPDGFEGKGTYTMLQFVAIKDYEGSMTRTLEALGLAYNVLDLKTIQKSPALAPARELAEDDDDDDARIIFPARHFIDTPAPVPLIDGYLFKRSHAMLIGESGAGKSLVALDWSASISQGRPWAGRDVQQGPVIYVAGEGFPGFVQRMHAWADGHDMPSMWDNLQVVRDPYTIPASEREVDATKWWRRFIAQAADLGPPMMVLDTFARVTVGMNENDSAEMGRVIDQFGQIIEHVDTTVLVVHHTAKSTGMARGSSALRAAVDSEFKVIPDKDMPKSVIVLSTTKQKDAEKADDMALAIIKQKTRQGSSVYVDELNLKTVGGNNIQSTIQDAVVAHLKGSDRIKVRITDVQLALGETYSKTAITTALTNLLADGTVMHPDGGRGKPLTTSVQLSDTSKTTIPQEEDNDHDSGSDSPSTDA